MWKMGSKELGKGPTFPRGNAIIIVKIFGSRLVIVGDLSISL